MNANNHPEEPVSQSRFSFAPHVVCENVGYIRGVWLAIEERKCSPRVQNYSYTTFSCRSVRSWNYISLQVLFLLIKFCVYYAVFELPFPFFPLSRPTTPVFYLVRHLTQIRVCGATNSLRRYCFSVRSVNDFAFQIESIGTFGWWKFMLLLCVDNVRRGSVLKAAIRFSFTVWNCFSRKFGRQSYVLWCEARVVTWVSIASKWLTAGEAAALESVPVPGPRSAMMTVDDDQLLEYEEDGYLEFVRKSETPSFDADEPNSDLLLFSTSLLSPSANWSATNFVIAEDDDDEHSFSIETEFVAQHQRGHKQRPRIRDVRVKFQDLSKPYLARITNNQNYLKFLHLVKGQCCRLTRIRMRTLISLCEWLRFSVNRSCARMRVLALGHSTLPKKTLLLSKWKYHIDMLFIYINTS